MFTFAAQTLITQVISSLTTLFSCFLSWVLVITFLEG